MANKKSSALSDVQKWFSVDLYERLSSFDNAQWAQQIAKRTFLLKAIEAREIELARSMLLSIEDAPLEDFSFQYRATDDVITGLSYSTNSVIPLSFTDLHRLADLRRMFPEGSDGGIDSWSGNTLGMEAMNRFAHLKVDLNGNDEEIVRDFGAWLSAYRTAIHDRPEKRRYGDWRTKCSSWVAQRLIPYFDITTWAFVTQQHLKEPELIELLYGDSARQSRNSLRALKRNVPQVFTLTTAIALMMAMT